MNTPKWVPPLFLVAACYDGALGLMFLAAPLAVFGLAGVTPPNHVAYAQFPAALLLVFALMFLQIARNPIGCRNLIPYGILLKAAYCGVAGWHWIASGIPDIWKLFLIIDVMMGLLFVCAYRVLPRTEPVNPAA